MLLLLLKRLHCPPPCPLCVADVLHMQGGSRRRLKKHARKVRVGVVKVKKNTKAQVPLELLDGRTSVHHKLKTK